MAIYSYFGMAAALSYALIVTLLARQFFFSKSFKRSLFYSIGFASLFLHGLMCFLQIASPQGYHFDMASALSLSVFLSAFFLYVMTYFEPIDNLGIIIFPIAILSIIASLIFSTPPHLHTKTISSTPILLHIFLALSSNALITLASLQSGLLAFQHYQLKHRHPSSFFQQFPALETMEKILFQLIWLGVILLSLGIATGFLFYENLLAQHLSHKTFFTICAWVIFVTLLTGRHIFGWRGIQAVRWTNWGFFILLLGFVGSGIVLEVILKTP